MRWLGGRVRGWAGLSCCAKGGRGWGRMPGQQPSAIAHRRAGLARAEPGSLIHGSSLLCRPSRLLAGLSGPSRPRLARRPAATCGPMLTLVVFWFSQPACPPLLAALPARLPRPPSAWKPPARHPGRLHCASAPDCGLCGAANRHVQGQRSASDCVACAAHRVPQCPRLPKWPCHRREVTSPSQPVGWGCAPLSAAALPSHAKSGQSRRSGPTKASEKPPHLARRLQVRLFLFSCARAANSEDPRPPPARSPARPFARAWAAGRGLRAGRAGRRLCKA